LRYRDRVLNWSRNGNSVTVIEGGLQMTNQYLWDRIAGRDANLRAADADRERTAERLRKGHAEGRLDTAEFQQRLERCYEAKTFGELGELVRDLPRQDERDERRTSWSLRRWRLMPLVPFLLALFVLSTATGHHHHVWWLWIPLVFVFLRMFAWRRRHWSAGPRHRPGEWI
jgi:uncharacterized protein DUF1707